ncbi:UNKNOWN [Stylonychia lemnae]|uniref:Uncharacterized protein n=1 Tax=Stylonychia lemnae TaxID=5949 RepID=A0A077ZZG1_STYLE|nr:UNKNOWN [Stylonychia lemnae]|eukprot:CDW74618.1 UNKNOWN [Stylonychia lemnae]
MLVDTSASAGAGLVDRNPNTVNINVTFNEVNFSSEEESVDVPDELDYHKRKLAEQQRKMSQTFNQQPSSIKQIQEKLSKKKKDQRDSNKLKNLGLYSNNGSHNTYTNSRQQSKIFKTSQNNTDKKHYIQAVSSYPDYYRSIQSTPLKINSPSNKMSKPKGDSTKKKHTSSISTKQQQSQTHSLRSILEQTKKFVPNLSYVQSVNNKVDWQRASFTPLTTKQKDNPWINFGSQQKPRLVSTPRQGLTPTSFRSITPTRFPTSNLYQNIPNLRSRPASKSNNNRVAYNKSKNNKNAMDTSISNTNASIFDRLLKDNERRIATKQRMEDIKKDKDDGRSVSPINKTLNMFQSQSKYINSRDITLEQEALLNSKHATPRNNRRFNLNDRTGSAARSMTPSSRLSSRSRRQQEDMVNRFKDLEYKRVMTIQEKAQQKLQETLEEIKRSPFSGIKLDLSKEQQEEIVQQVVKRLQFDNEQRLKRQQYTQNAYLSSSKKSSTGITDKSSQSKKQPQKYRMGGQGKQGQQKIQMVKRSIGGQQSQPTFANTKDSYGRQSDIDYQYHSLQQLVREELDQVRQGCNYNPYGRNIGKNETVPQKSTTHDLSSKNDYAVKTLVDEKNMFAKRFSEQVDNKMINLADNKSVGYHQSIANKEPQNNLAKQQEIKPYNDFEIQPNNAQYLVQPAKIFDDDQNLKSSFAIEQRLDFDKKQEIQSQFQDNDVGNRDSFHNDQNLSSHFHEQDDESHHSSKKIELDIGTPMKEELSDTQLFNQLEKQINQDLKQVSFRAQNIDENFHHQHQNDKQIHRNDDSNDHENTNPFEDASYSSPQKQNAEIYMTHENQPRASRINSVHNMDQLSPIQGENRDTKEMEFELELEEEEQIQVLQVAMHEPIKVFAKDQSLE